MVTINFTFLKLKSVQAMSLKLSPDWLYKYGDTRIF